MKHITRSIAALPLLLALLSPQRIDAQILSRGDLFGPGAPPPFAGIEVALGKHAQQGTFDASCGCTFQNGDGTGFMGAAFFELPLDYSWAIGLKAGVDFKNTKSTFGITESAIIQSGTAGGAYDTVAQMPLNRIGTVSMTYLNLLPYVQFQFYRMGPFVQAGLQAGMLLSNHFTQQRELTQTSIVVNGSPVTDLRFQNGTIDETLDDTTITDVSKLRLGLVLSAGYNVQVSERSVLSPLLTYDFPLTTVRTTNASGWKIGSLYASVELKFRLD
ncbi:MAG: outer membrane beta-barrel protein [Bacteroidota bacterium]|nr:outer membrane beta-barrel protein [Bacteroidota bacterium]MDP4234094.1 outer membrane beta-barrel protein [Bacteroidota bacterium]MDP4243035.1 outer membrane beta-barrel protein [Bacteroidota bacterium]MDP4287461.1 outer membrane beta-barrel protein [Bacteroidota bacterium]